MNDEEAKSKLIEPIDERFVGAEIISGYLDRLKGVYRLEMEREGGRFEAVITVRNCNPVLKVKE